MTSLFSFAGWTEKNFNCVYLKWGANEALDWIKAYLIAERMKYSPGPGGGGDFVYLSDGDVTFFRVSFSPIFSRTGYQKKANFLEQVVKTCQKTKFCFKGLSFGQFLCF